MSKRKLFPTSTHWGNYRVEADGEALIAVHPYDVDREPAPIGQSLLDALDPNVRVARPAIRKGYLDDSRGQTGEGRRNEPFVEVSWDTALDLAATAIKQTYSEHGANGIYGGSYCWASAGRFHHAQSQIHRFLSMAGGYVASVNSYSTAAAEVERFDMELPAISVGQLPPMTPSS